MMFKWIISILTVIVNVIHLIDGLQCHRISVKTCQGLGYNMTALPNLALHKIQIEAELEITTLLPLLESECSKQIRFLICSALFPLCSPDVPRPVTACKPLCETVRTDCATQPHLEHLWPTFLNCENLPQPDKQELCMQVPQEEMMLEKTKTSGIESSLVSGSSIPSSSSSLATMLGGSTAISNSMSIENNKNNNNLDQSQQSLQPSPPFTWPWLSWSQHHHHRTLSKIICPVNFTSDGDDCVSQCDTDAIYTSQQKKMAEAIILTLSALCFLLTLFSLVTFWAEPTRFGYPERPILYLGLCYTLLSVCYLERIIFHYPAKENINEENNTCMLSPPCLASFITIGYLTLCAASWWLIFALSFYLSSNKKWSNEAIEKKSNLFHVLAWLPPLTPPICALLWGAVKPHELTGICTAPGFIEIPTIILLLIGIIFIQLTSKSLKKLQKQIRISNNSNNLFRFSQIRKRLLIFSLMYFIPAILAMLFTFFEKFNIRLPSCQSYDTCEQPEKQSSIITVFKLFFHLISGSLTGMWVWSRKTCESYKHRIISVSTSGGTATTTTNLGTTGTTRTIISSTLMTKSFASIPKKNGNSKQITPFYNGINFHNVPIYNGHSRV